MAEKQSLSFTPDQVFAKAKTGELEGGNLGNIKLPKADLSGAKLRKIVAAGANLRKANLSGADLSGADLADADLREANLTGADLTGADLGQVKAKEADFTGAKLVGAKAIQGDFGKATFKNADLTGADLSKAVFYKGRIEDTKLTGAQMPEVEAADADLLGVDLTGADLRDAIFQECRIERVQATGLTAHGADFSLAEIRGVDFSRAALPKAQFFGAVLEHVNFAGADLAGAVFNGSEHNEVTFAGADLKKASLKSVYGYTEDALRVYQSQGAIIDLFLFRRFLRLVRRSLVAKIVLLAAVAALAGSSYRYFADPYHWSYDVLQKRAEKLIHQGDFDKGIQLYRVITQKYSSDPNRVATAKTSIAGAYAQQRNFDKALELYQDVAATYDGNPEAVFALDAMARLYGDMGDAEKAAAIFEKIRQTEVDNPDAEANAEFGLADLLRKAGKQEEALAKYLAVFDKFQSEVNIGNRALSEAVAVMCELDRLDDAEKTLARLKEYDSGSSNAWQRINAETAIAHVFAKRGEFAQAEKRFRAIYDSYKDLMQSGGAGFSLVELEMSQGKYKEAEAQIADMLKRANTEELRDELLYRQARLYEQMGQPEKAVALLTTELPKIKDHAKYFDAASLLLELYAAKGDVALAEGVYNGCAKKFADDADRTTGLRLAMARIYGARGLPEKARAIYADVIAHSSNRELVATAKSDLAGELRRGGANEKAEQIYRELYAEVGDSSRAFGAGMSLVDYYTENQQFPAAQKLLADMETRWRNKAREHGDIQMRTVRVLQQLGQIDVAIARLKALLPELEDPQKQFEAQNQFLDLYRVTDNLPAAEEVFGVIQQRFGQDLGKIARAKALMAQFYANKGLNEKAEALYRDILTQSVSGDAALQAKLDLASQYRRAKAIDKAEKLYRELLAGSVDTWQAFQGGIALADMFAEENSFDASEKVLAEMSKKWEAKDSERSEIILHQARLLQRLNRLDEAAALLKKELPTFSDPHKAMDGNFLLIDLCGAAGDLKGAEENVKNVLKSVAGDPDRTAQAKCILGQTYTRQGQDDKAEAIFREVFTQYPNSTVAIQAKADYAGVLRRKGETAKAELIYRELAANPAENWQVFAATTTLADIYADEGKAAEADKLLDDMLKRWTNKDQRTEIVVHRARMYQKLNRLDDALALLRSETGKTADPSRLTEMNFLIMELYAAKGDLHAAEDAFSQLAKSLGGQSEQIANAKMSLAQMYVNQGHGERAAGLYQEIIAKYPDLNIALQAKLNLANEMHREGNAAQTEKLLRELQNDKKESWESFNAGLGLADLLSDQQKFDEADALLSEMLKKYAAKPVERADVIMRRAALLQRQQKPDVAAALLTEQLPKITDHVRRFEAYRMMLELDRTMDNLAAMEALQPTIAKEFAGDAERFPAIQIIFGQMYAAKGMNDKAIALLQEIAAKNGRSDAGFSARLELANLRRRTGEVAKAEQGFREMLDEPGLPWQAFNAGMSCIDMLDEQARLADEDKLLAKMRKMWTSPGNERAEIIIRQARLLRKLKKTTEAAALLDG